MGKIVSISLVCWIEATVLFPVRNLIAPYVPEYHYYFALPILGVSYPLQRILYVLREPLTQVKHDRKLLVSADTFDSSYSLHTTSRP